jgi:hypothetical protein
MTDNVNNVNMPQLWKEAHELGIDIERDGIYIGRQCDEASRNNPIPYPNKNDFKAYNAYQGGKVLGTNLNECQRDAIRLNNKDVLIETMFDEESYKTAKDDYHEYSAKIYRVFNWGLFHTYDLLDNPKAAKAFSIAWNHGHSAGFQEVANYFDDLVELIK